MSLSEASAKAAKLRKEIWRHNHLYYVLDQPEVSDAAYDRLLHELLALEARYPKLITPDSPTQRVGAPPASGRFATHPHVHPKQSLQDIFSLAELRTWEERLRKLLPQEKWTYFCEPKVDGLNITISYQAGRFLHALTRGDGVNGEDVSHTARTIRSLPLQLDYDGNLEVSGEVYLSRRAFAELNQARAKTDEPLFANPRNAAAGSLRQLDPKVAAERNLDIIFYDLYLKDGPTANTPATRVAMNKRLRELGFKTDQYAKPCHGFASVIAYCQEMASLRQRLPYATDGVVVKVNEQELYERLGSTAKAPRWAVAFKFPPEAAEAKILDIIVQVGRTGALTPVAVLTPVQLSGTTVTRATLHNEEEIERKDVRIGDTVSVHKAGEIIPEILSVNLKKRPTGTKSFRLPKNCPICGSATMKPEGEVIRRCQNKQCAQQQLGKLKHFVSRGAFDMEGIGPKLLTKLLAEGLIISPADLFRLKEADLNHLERLAEKSAQNIVSAIQKAKSISLDRFLYALGIRHVGDQTAADLARFLNQRHAKDPLDALTHLSTDDLSQIEGVGPIVAKAITDWLAEPPQQKLLKDLLASGVQLKKEASPASNNAINGKTFVFTGTLETIDRSAAETLVRKLGGKASGSVGKSTNYVVAGHNPGSKLAKAQTLKIPVLSEAEFKNLAGLV